MIIGIIFTILAVVFAQRKGYAWWAFFLSGLFGLIALAFLPFVKGEKAPADPAQADRLRKNGNYVGLGVSGVCLVLGILLAVVSAATSHN